MSQRKDYEGRSTNASTCYSNMKCYGANGNYRPIIPPTPVTVQPALFNILKPTPYQTDYRKTHQAQQRNFNCIPYRKLDGLCNVCDMKS